MKASGTNIISNTPCVAIEIATKLVTISQKILNSILNIYKKLIFMLDVCVLAT